MYPAGCHPTWRGLVEAVALLVALGGTARARQLEGGSKGGAKGAPRRPPRLSPMGNCPRISSMLATPAHSSSSNSSTSNSLGRGRSTMAAGWVVAGAL